MELRLGTWNMHALGWNGLQMLLGSKVEDQDGVSGRWVPEAVHLDVLGVTKTHLKDRSSTYIGYM